VPDEPTGDCVIHSLDLPVDTVRARSFAMAGCSLVKLRPSEFRDPGQLVADVMTTHPLAKGDVLLALVHDPSGDQDIVEVRSLAGANWADLDRYGRSRFLHDEARKLPVPDWTRGEGPRHSIMTIVARRGFAVVGPDEAAWLIAWRYSNHTTHAYSGDLILITEHGWTDFMTGWGGSRPHLA
jgi:hypothetical protein